MIGYICLLLTAVLALHSTCSLLHGKNVINVVEDSFCP